MISPAGGFPGIGDPGRSISKAVIGRQQGFSLVFDENTRTPVPGTFISVGDPARLAGQLVPVKVSECTGFSLYGEAALPVSV